MEEDVDLFFDTEHESYAVVEKELKELDRASAPVSIRAAALNYLGDITLNVYSRFFRIQTAGQVLSQDGTDAVLNVLRGGVCGQGMPVCYKEEASVQILKLYEACHCTVVVAKV